MSTHITYSDVAKPDKVKSQNVPISSKQSHASPPPPPLQQQDGYNPSLSPTFIIFLLIEAKTVMADCSNYYSMTSYR
jgi:hypothetical protein